MNKLDEILSLAAALDPSEIASIKIAVTFAGGATREVNVTLAQKAVEQKQKPPVRYAAPLAPIEVSYGGHPSAALTIFGPDWSSDPIPEPTRPHLRLVADSEGDIA